MIPILSALRRSAPAAVLAVALAAGLGACAGVSSQAALPPMAALPSGTEIKHPRPALYTSGQPAEGDWRALADAGVRTVINLRTAKEMQGRDARAEVEAAGMRYLELPIDGAAAVNPENARALSDLLRAQRGPVLLHCASGNRVGGLLALGAAQEGVPVEEALAYGRSAGMKSTEKTVRETLGVPTEAASP